MGSSTSGCDKALCLMLPVLGQLFMSGVIYGIGIVMFVLLCLAVPQLGQALLLLVGLVMSIGTLNVLETTTFHLEVEEEEEEELPSTSWMDEPWVDNEQPKKSKPSKRERRACARGRMLARMSEVVRVRIGLLAYLYVYYIAPTLLQHIAMLSSFGLLVLQLQAKE